ncbi:hypothetical protein D6829_00120 [Candidatus Pacearchaeota archaeon]|nr:MAG: hypothetical protein D6829_00120 [Candidatus Pacearchaeota archaeon]
MPVFEDIFSGKEVQNEELSRILVDNREKNSLVAHLLAGRFDVCFENLEIGDYVVGDVVVERKTVSDFVNSIYDGRLFLQAKELLKAPQKIFLIEGAKELEGKRQKAFDSALFSICLDFQIPVVRTECAEESASLISKILEKTRKNEGFFRGRKSRLSLREQKELVLQGFFGVGAQKSRKLLDEFGSLLGVFGASVDDLSRVIDKRTAMRIWSLLRD